MRFLHTSDWHIGLHAAHAGAAAPRLRQERFAAARRIAALAQSLHPDFVLLAGDTFDSNAPHPADIRETAALLAAFPCPVFLIPGNHDPHVPGGPWLHPAWSAAPNVHPLLTPEPVPLPGGALFPCPLLSRWQSANPLAWIPPALPEHGIRLGLAHGSLSTFNGPIPPDAASLHQLDYLALGDWHSATPLTPQPLRQAYSGTPEPDAFSQPNSGSVFLIDIPHPGAPPSITSHRTARLAWQKQTATLRAPGDALRLRLELEAAASPDLLLDLTLEGSLFPGDDDELLRLETALAERCFLARISRGPLWPAASETTLPPGPLSLTETRLREQSASGDPVAAAALLELHRLAREAGL